MNKRNNKHAIRKINKKPRDFFVITYKYSYMKHLSKNETQEMITKSPRNHQRVKQIYSFFSRLLWSYFKVFLVTAKNIFLVSIDDEKSKSIFKEHLRIYKPILFDSFFMTEMLSRMIYTILKQVCHFCGEYHWKEAPHLNAEIFITII